MLDHLTEEKREKFFYTLSRVRHTLIENGETPDFWLAPWVGLFRPQYGQEEYIEVNGVRKIKTYFQEFMATFAEFMIEMCPLDEWDEWVIKLFGIHHLDRCTGGIGAYGCFQHRWLLALTIALDLTEKDDEDYHFQRYDFSIPPEYRTHFMSPVHEYIAKYCDVDDPVWVQGRDEKLKKAKEAYYLKHPKPILTPAQKKEMEEFKREIWGDQNFWQRLMNDVEYNTYTHAVSKLPEGAFEVSPGVWQLPQPAPKPDEAFDKDGTPIPPYTHEWNEAMRKKYFGWPSYDILGPYCVPELGGMVF